MYFGNHYSLQELEVLHAKRLKLETGSKTGSPETKLEVFATKIRNWKQNWKHLLLKLETRSKTGSPEIKLEVFATKIRTGSPETKLEAIRNQKLIWKLETGNWKTEWATIVCRPSLWPMTAQEW